MPAPVLTPEERAVAEVYRAAAHTLLGAVSDGARQVVEASDDAQDRARAQALRQVEQTAAAVAADLDLHAPGRISAAIGAAYRLGQGEAVRALRRLGALPDRDPYADRWQRGAIDRLAAAVVDRLSPVHAAILRTTTDAFRAVISRVLPEAVVGTQTRRQAVQRALWELADRGVSAFVDRAGRRWRLDTYAEMAVRTGSARALVDGQLDRLASLDHDLVFVQGTSACTRCAPWQGKVLSNGAGPLGWVQVESAVADASVRVFVAGTVLAARAAGLLHPNCRCSLSAFVPGATDLAANRPAPGDDETYAAEQRQRAIERRIRRWKERETVALDDAERRYARAGVRAAQGDMRAHLAAHPQLARRPQRERLNQGYSRRRPAARA